MPGKHRAAELPYHRHTVHRRSGIIIQAKPAGERYTAAADKPTPRDIIGKETDLNEGKGQKDTGQPCL
jgi:hypothetical protein